MKTRCTATTKAGEPCKARAVAGTDPPRCLTHSMSDEERSEHARKMAAASAIVRQAKAKPKAGANITPGVTREELYDVIRPALSAKLETGEADWSARFAACAVLVLSFPLHYRRTPEDVRALLDRAVPPSVLDDETRRRASAQALYTSLRAEWVKLPTWHPIRGLVHEPFPADLIAPWEDRETVLRDELPADVPPDEAPVLRFEDGTVALRREGEFPLVLEPAA